MLFWCIRKPIIRKFTKNIIRKERNQISISVWKPLIESGRQEFIKWVWVFYWVWKTGELTVFSTHSISITFKNNIGKAGIRFRFQGFDLPKELLNPILSCQTEIYCS